MSHKVQLFEIKTALKMSLYSASNDKGKSQNSFVIRTLPALGRSCNEIYHIILFMYKQHGPQGRPPSSRQTDKQQRGFWWYITAVPYRDGATNHHMTCALEHRIRSCYLDGGSSWVTDYLPRPDAKWAAYTSTLSAIVSACF